MKAIQSLFRTTNEIEPLILRVLLALVMFPHGAQKVLGWFGGHGFEGSMQFLTQSMHIPPVFAFLDILAEFAGPILLLLGLLSRVSAFGIGVMITVAALMVHVPNGFFMNWYGNQKGEGFEYHILMFAIAVALLIRGGGKWAIDSVIYRHLLHKESEEHLPADAKGGAFAH